MLYLCVKHIIHKFIMIRCGEVFALNIWNYLQHNLLS